MVQPQMNEAMKIQADLRLLFFIFASGALLFWELIKISPFPRIL
jgi:hypothetical protein